MSAEARHFEDQKSQTEQLWKVTQMLSSHLKESKRGAQGCGASS